MSRLIIKNLPKNFTEDKIRKLFSQKGEITDIQLKFTKDGKFRQFGFVGYRTEEQAQEAIKFFDNSFVQTNKISVEVCAQLGHESKPKAWSKYASDSTAYKKEHKKDNKNEETAEITEEATKSDKKSKITELVEKYKDDPLFEEFMQLHGTKDIKTLLDKLEEGAKKLESSEDQNSLNDNSTNEDSGLESTEENEDKVANKKISDLEYMKLLMNKSTGIQKQPRKRMEKQPKKEKLLFTVKLRGLAYTCKKKDIKEFFKPNIPFTVRIPPKIKGIAYATFKTEKKMNQALIKDRSFLGGKRITVYKHSNTKQIENAEGTNDIEKNKWTSQEESLKNEENIAESGRIFIRNLAYSTTENDVQELFSKYGPITEINLPVDKFTRQLKGFGIITFLMPEHAVQAYSELDGSILQGRMLHLLPGKSKDTDEVPNTEGLSYKEKKALKDKATAGSSHNWNSLFMGHNAVADAIADNYGTSKEQVLDGRGPGSAAVRLALGETQFVAQTKEFLEEMGVCLDAFNQPASQRSKTVILAKNLPAQTQANEIQNIFSPFGVLGRVVLPPNGITALVEFLEPSEARKAFSKLAYTKFKNAPLYLEWAPENSFSTVAKINKEKISKKDTENKTEPKEDIKVDIKEEINDENEDEDEDDEPEDDTTLFVKNLNFSTTDATLRKHFEPCGKINYVTVAMKKDPQNPGQKLSMGYGFVRFQYQKSANKALRDLQMSTLEGKTLEIKRSERTLQNEVKSTRKKTNVTKQTGTKILVRNIPFQANQNEINELFKAFGEIKALRLPKKLTSGAERHRGFAFVDYVTKSDAKRAFQALCQSTHLYGRRLVLEWASAEEDVEDIRKRTAKHFHKNEEVKNKKSRLDVDTFISN